jgi:hypothetical protein
MKKLQTILLARPELEKKEATIPLPSPIDSWLATLDHEQLEELCCLASVGAIEEAEWQIVRVHLEECASCRSAFSDLGVFQSVCLGRATGSVLKPILRAASREILGPRPASEDSAKSSTLR